MYYTDKDYENALYFFLENYKTEINKKTSLKMLGKIFHKLGEDAKALLAYKKLSDDFTNSTHGLYEIGKIYFNKNMFELALEKFIHVVTIDPRHFKCHVFIAGTKLKL